MKFQLMSRHFHLISSFFNTLRHILPYLAQYYFDRAGLLIPIHFFAGTG
jgi:hypothetical protein